MTEQHFEQWADRRRAVCGLDDGELRELWYKKHTEMSGWQTLCCLIFLPSGSGLLATQYMWLFSAWNWWPTLVCFGALLVAGVGFFVVPSSKEES